MQFTICYLKTNYFKNVFLFCTETIEKTVINLVQEILKLEEITLT